MIYITTAVASGMGTQYEPDLLKRKKYLQGCANIAGFAKVSKPQPNITNFIVEEFLK